MYFKNGKIKEYKTKKNIRKLRLSGWKFNISERHLKMASAQFLYAKGKNCFTVQRIIWRDSHQKMLSLSQGNPTNAIKVYLLMM